MVRKRKSADVVIVGGGCMGTSIAWHLARRGADVVLLEKNHLASGSTGHSGALVRRHYEHPIGIALAHESLRFFETFRARTGHDAGFVRVGFTTGARKADVAALERLVALQRVHHVAAKLVSPDELKVLEPGMRVDDLAMGLHDPRAGYADPIATTLGFANAAMESGAEVHESVAIDRILVEDGRAVGVQGKHAEVRAPAVIVAAGNDTPSLLARVRILVPIRFVRGEVVILRRPPGSGPAPRLHFDYYEDTYSRPESPRDTLVGHLGTHPQKDQPIPTPFDGTVSESTAKDLRARLAARFPAFTQSQLRGGWAGLYDVTPDRYPILGPLGPEGLFVSAGFSGHGFKLCPAVGRLLADRVLDKRGDPILESLSMSRFRQRHPIRPVAPFPAGGQRLP